MDRPGSGMRRLIGLFLLLNLGLLAVGLGFTFWPVKREPALEFNADKVRLVTVPEAVKAAAPEPASPVPPAAEPPAQPAEPTQGAGAASANPSPPTSCLSWPGLDADKLQAVIGHLGQIGLAAGGYELRLDQRLGWWVYLPPFKDARAQSAAMEDARQKGVADLAPVRGGKLANAVSLGAFPSLEKARAHAEALAAKGLKGLKFGPRPESGEVRLLLAAKPSARVVEGLARDWPAGVKPGRCEAGSGE